MSDRHSLPIAVDRAYALWVWLDGRLVDFPATARLLAGRRTFDAATDVLDALLEATYASRGDRRRHDALVRVFCLGGNAWGPTSVSWCPCA